MKIHWSNKPNREKDAIIAILIFGWVWYKDNQLNLRALLPPNLEEYHCSGIPNSSRGYTKITDIESDVPLYGDWDELVYNKETGQGLPYYSSDIKDSWELVEKLRQNNVWKDIHIESLGDVWSVSTCYDKKEWQNWSNSDSVTESICKAALIHAGHILI